VVGVVQFGVDQFAEHVSAGGADNGDGRLSCWQEDVL